jgi:hypothetical protein
MLETISRHNSTKRIWCPVRDVLLGSRRRWKEPPTLTILLEDQLALLAFVFVLSTSPVLATLYYMTIDSRSHGVQGGK